MVVHGAIAGWAALPGGSSKDSTAKDANNAKGAAGRAAGSCPSRCRVELLHLRVLRVLRLPFLVCLPAALKQEGGQNADER